jgi:hypothetical protein
MFNRLVTVFAGDVHASPAKTVSDLTPRTFLSYLLLNQHFCIGLAQVASCQLLHPDTRHYAQ